MGFGPIPNIFCAEIFPTRVRGNCIAICAFSSWVGDIIVTYTLPLMLSSIGLAGVFGIYAAVCVISLVFVFLKVPETKGMPLELLELEESWNLILDDAMVSSFISPIRDAIEDDKQLIVEEYERSWEQNEALGLNDMDTSFADIAYDTATHPATGQ
ncbi:uncharacterized protein A4U43_C07F29870 [Asparagus officinalis]|uniref:Major facilitator superfamily (MFS) profile domain-containing protein n=1 Tax=Asparagus officinalis TaxID=4686 RepID=A0A5P1EG96_ASPOF|nr:uncharacterized protein A4U43_C07F29870 [Asparagus officinalis]